MSDNVQVIESPDDEGVLYVKFKASMAGGAIKQLRLHDLIEYSGADLYFDFNENGELIGVEILS